MNQPTLLEDFKINTKLKLSALWTALTLCYLYGDYFELYTPGKVEGLISGENVLDTPVKLFLASVMLVIPAVMVFLSVFLKPTINRFINVVFGVFFVLVMTLILVTSITPWYSFYVFLAAVEVLIALMILWHAIKWPKV